jgi:hypothetical protein
MVKRIVLLNRDEIVGGMNIYGGEFGLSVLDDGINTFSPTLHAVLDSACFISFPFKISHCFLSQ